MAEAEEYAGGDEDVAAAEQEEDVDEVSAAVLWMGWALPCWWEWFVWEGGWQKIVWGGWVCVHGCGWVACVQRLALCGRVGVICVGGRQ